MQKRKKRSMFLISIISFLLLIFAVGITFAYAHPSLGRSPRGKRLERIKQSPNYRDGQFCNLSYTPLMEDNDKSLLLNLWEFLFKKTPGLKPNRDIPVVKNNLHELDNNLEFIQWLGHSSMYIQTNGLRFLIDPVLTNKWPESMMLKPFKGTNIYSTDDLPNIDYLIITHDHWDHLDYHTIKKLKDKVNVYICPLGVGEHLERWGVNPTDIIEMDWQDENMLNDDAKIYCLPARHFSGRTFKRNKTLWASYPLQLPDKKIYISGDGGYDTHFKEIGERFGEITLATLENGQYNDNWKYIHLMPNDLVKAINDLNAKKIITTHHSKFALAHHPWQEPIELVASKADSIHSQLIIPIIGEIIKFDETPPTQLWWKDN